ncbi:MAG: tape measure protein [Clostridia bacterium]
MIERSSMADGSIIIDTKLNKSELEKGLKNLDKTIKNTLPSANLTLNDFSKGFSTLGKFATNAGIIISTTATASIAALGVSTGKTAISFMKLKENTNIAFKVLLGSAEKAKEMLDNLYTFAKTTPFSYDTFLKASKAFLAMGISANDCIPYLSKLTNAAISTGSGQVGIDILTESIGRMSAKGKVQLEELNRVTELGIPAIKILGNAYGESEENIYKMMETGKILSKEALPKLLDGMEKGTNGVNGITAAYGGLANEMKGTLDGAMDSMNSAFRNMALEVLNAEGSYSGLKDVVKAFTEVIKNLGPVFKSVAEQSGPLLKSLSDKLNEFSEKLKTADSEELKKIGNAILKLAAAGPLLIVVGKAFGMISGALSGIGSVVGALKMVSGVTSTISAGAMSGTAAVSSLSVVFSALTGPIGIAIAIILAVIAVLVLLWNKSEAFRSAVTNAFSNIQDALHKMWNRLQPVFEKIGELFGTAMTSLEPLIDLLGKGLGNTITMISGVIVGFINMIAPLLEGTLNMISGISNVLQGVWALISGDFEGFKSHMGSAGEDFKNMFLNIWEAIKGFFTGFFDTIGVDLQNGWNSISNFFQEQWNGFILNVQHFGETISLVFQNMWNSIVLFFTVTIPALISSIVTWFQELPYKLGFIIGQTIGNIINFGIQLWSWVTTELPKIIEGIIVWFQELPGRIWEWLQNAISNFIQWCVQMNITANEKISEVISSIIVWFQELPGRIWEWLQNAINNFIQWCVQMNITANEKIGEIINSITSWFKELPKNMIEWGKDMIKGFIDGIKSGIGKIGEAVSGITDGIRSVLHFSKPDEGPLRDYESWMPDMIDGLTKTLELSSPKLFKASKKLANQIYEDFNLDNAFKKLAFSVDLETSKLLSYKKADANLKASKDNVKTINNDNGTTVQNTQNFYQKVESPSEIAKKTKQSLRRIVYGL